LPAKIGTAAKTERAGPEMPDRRFIESPRRLPQVWQDLPLMVTWDSLPLTD